MAKFWISSAIDIIRPCGDPTHRDVNACRVKESTGFKFKECIFCAWTTGVTRPKHNERLCIACFHELAGYVL